MHKTIYSQVSKKNFLLFFIGLTIIVVGLGLLLWVKKTEKTKIGADVTGAQSAIAATATFTDATGDQYTINSNSVTTTLLPPVNMIKNGDFEMGNTLWPKVISEVSSGTKGVIQIIPSPECYLGTGNCLIMNKNNSANLYASQWISTFEAGKTYKLSAKFKTLNATGTPQAFMQVYDPVTKQYLRTAKVGAENNQWKDLTGEFAIAPVNTGHSILISFYGNWVPTGTLIYDNITLLKTN